MKKYLSALSLVLMLTGCMNFEYQGRKLDETSKEVTLFEKKDKIELPYEVLGVAQVSGNYTNISRDRMQQRLLDKAMDFGADAVLITGEKVVLQDADVPMLSDFGIAGYGDAYVSSNNMVIRDFQATQGEGPTTNTYNRVLKAEFLKYKTQP